MPLFTFANHSKARIFVIGYKLLVRYVNGSCERILPKASVELVDVNEMFTVWAMRTNSNR